MDKSIWELQRLVKDAITTGDLDTLQKELEIDGNIHTINSSEIFRYPIFNCIHFAIDHKQLEIAKFLVEKGLDPCSKNGKGDNCLHSTAKSGDTNFVKLFLNNVDVNKKNRDGMAPLFIAVKSGNYDVAQLLLQSGAHVNTMLGKTRNAPLHDAVASKNLRLLELLLKHNADPNRENVEGDTAFHRAIYTFWKKDVLDLFLSHGAYLGTGFDLSKITRFNFNNVREAMETFLKAKEDRGELSSAELAKIMHLILSTDLKFKNMMLSVVQLFLDRGVNVDAVDVDGKTALYKAIIGDYSKVAQRLLVLKADANGNSRWRPIVAAVRTGNIEMVKILHGNYGAAIKFKDVGFGLLKIALDNIKHPRTRHSMIDLLLNIGVNVGDEDTSDEPVMRSCVLNVDYMEIAQINVATMTLLMKNGAIVNDKLFLRDVISSKTAKNHPLKILIEHGKLNVNDDIVVPGLLHEALALRKPRLIEYLLDQGADINIDYEYELPLGRVQSHSRNIEYMGVIGVLIRQLALLLAQSLHVNEENMTILNNSDAWMIEYYQNSCKALENSKTMRVDEKFSLTFFQILTKRNLALVKCLGNARVRDKLAVCNFTELEDYAERAQSNYSRGVQLFGRFQKFENLLKDVFGKFLPYDLVHYIADYYNDEDFRECIDFKIQF